MGAHTERLEARPTLSAPVLTLRVGREAPDGGEVRGTMPEALDALDRWLGPARPGFSRAAFAGYDVAEGTALGRTVATARILRAVPPFIQRVEIAWSMLATEQRAQVVGFHPALLAVLRDEALALRGINLRFDARARAESVSRESRETAARESIADGRGAFERTIGIARRWAPPSFVARTPLPELPEAIDPDALPRALDALADWVSTWRASWTDDDARAAYETLGFDESLSRALRLTAASIREAQEVLTAVDDVSPATLRELAGQDGRVLHVMRLIHDAFARAAEADPRVVVPDLGELAGAFDPPRPWLDPGRESGADPSPRP